jgi:hypothetical protein
MPLTPCRRRITECRTPHTMPEVYRIYGQKQLQKTIAVDSETVKGLVKGLGAGAADANPANFVDASLVRAD